MRAIGPRLALLVGAPRHAQGHGRGPARACAGRRRRGGGPGRPRGDHRPQPVAVPGLRRRAWRGAGLRRRCSPSSRSIAFAILAGVRRGDPGHALLVAGVAGRVRVRPASCSRSRPRPSRWTRGCTSTRWAARGSCGCSTRTTSSGSCAGRSARSGPRDPRRDPGRALTAARPRSAGDGLPHPAVDEGLERGDRASSSGPSAVTRMAWPLLSRRPSPRAWTWHRPAPPRGPGSRA